MAQRHKAIFKHHPLVLALATTLLLPAVVNAQDANTTQDTASDKKANEADAQKTATTKAKSLDKVVVTGSLIPQTQIETFQPLTVISAEDISARGFTNLSEVLKQSTMSTGAVQGEQTSASFTQGAETISLFGLPAGYVKYLIDGRPMANYPALYNGSDTFNNISGIPIDLVERIEILPGGQSSLYGADALAGVINIILKKQMDGAVISVRGGIYTENGGTNYRVTVSDGFSAADGRLNVLVGLQHENRDPIWAYQRSITKQFNTNGSTPPIASRDFLVNGYQNFGGYFGIGTLAPHYGYLWPTGANCDNLGNLFEGTAGEQTRPGASFGKYCGSLYTPGYRTLRNGKKATQAYAHASFDLNSNTEIYGDLLVSQEKARYHIGSNYTWWGTSADFGYYYDPRYDGLLNLQRAFAPEDMPGGFESSMSEDRSKSYAVDFGVRGTFGESNWDYDFSISRTEYKLEEDSFVRWAKPMRDYFIAHVLGPQQGFDPYYGAYPVFTPDYAAFYNPINPADFAAMTGRAVSNSKTYDNLFRAQLVNGSLFSLPGGDAGIALAVEAGREGWSYDPYPGYLSGEVWGQTATGSSSGTRDRYAAIGELRLPLLKSFSVTTSARYDSWHNQGLSVNKPTYSVGLEWRPLESLLFRGKYGTAFRAISLPDQYQSESGAYGYVTDYYNCAVRGFDPAVPTSLENCPSLYSSKQIFMTTSGSAGLKPVNADVWNLGIVWAPKANLSFTADVFDWKIRDEITAFAAGATLFTEYRCRTGIEDITSAQCVDAISRIERNAGGTLVSVYAPKVNVASQSERAFTLAGSYQMDAGTLGSFSFRGSYSQILDHEYLAFAGDTSIDLVDDPYYSTDPKEKADVSVSWRKNDFTTTLYANWIGKTPNYIASNSDYSTAGAGKLPSFTTYNLSINWNVTEKLNLSLMSNNIFNKMPPYDPGYPGSSGAPYNSGNFSPYGRAVYFEARYAFGNSKN